MAKPTRVIHPLQISEEEGKETQLAELQNMLLENKEAILQLIELAAHLEERGILDILNALLAEGDQALHVAVKAIQSDGGTNLVKNLLLLVSMLGQLNLKELEPLLERLNNGVEEAANNQEKKINYLSLMKQFNDPEVQQGLSIGLTFLKGFGSKQ